MDSIKVSTKQDKEIVDITALIRKYARDNTIKNGVICIFVTHTTCAVTTAEAELDTNQDFLDAIEAIMPKLKYRHNHNPSHVVDHIASSLIGPSLTVFVENGELMLGTWQSIVLVELNGPRKRILLLKSFT